MALISPIIRRDSTGAEWYASTFFRRARFILHLELSAAETVRDFTIRNLLWRTYKRAVSWDCELLAPAVEAQKREEFSMRLPKSLQGHRWQRGNHASVGWS